MQRGPASCSKAPVDRVIPDQRKTSFLRRAPTMCGQATSIACRPSPLRTEPPNRRPASNADRDEGTGRLVRQRDERPRHPVPDGNRKNAPGAFPRSLRTRLLFTITRTGEPCPVGQQSQTSRFFLDDNPHQDPPRKGDASPKGPWWSQTGSNRRPHACKARALPAELWPRSAAERTRSNRRPALALRAQAFSPRIAMRSAGQARPARSPCLQSTRSPS